MPQTPPGGAGRGAAARESREPRSIGAVLGVLRKEFPEVTASRIRFLEAEGLIRPARSPSGCRRFGETDVQRLRRVLGMQRDDCMPLHAIRAQLDDGEPPQGASRPPAGPPVRARRHRLLEATGADDAECAEWEEYGLVRADESGDYDVGQVALARVLAELGHHGLEPRHLRAVKAAADRTACLIEQVVAPLRANRDPRTRERGEATARELTHLSARLHDAFLRSALQPPER